MLPQRNSLLGNNRLLYPLSSAKVDIFFHPSTITSAFNHGSSLEELWRLLFLASKCTPYILYNTISRQRNVPPTARNVSQLDTGWNRAISEQTRLPPRNEPNHGSEQIEQRIGDKKARSRCLRCNISEKKNGGWKVRREGWELTERRLDDAVAEDGRDQSVCMVRSEKSL